MDSDCPVSIVETLEDLECFAETLSEHPRIAVDLESNSFYSYHSKTCLVQISTDLEDVVVDPLAVKDMSPLSPLFRNADVEKVFHAAEYDVQCLKRDFGFEVHGLFDTMAAARRLGIRQLGLAPLIHQYFGVALSKKLQRADWGRRPLSPEQIEYARLDTHYLLRLRDTLSEELETKDLLQDAREEFLRLETLEPSERLFDPDLFWRLAGARQISAQSRAVLKELFVFREQTAAALDKAPFRVLPENLLVRLAEHLPQDLSSLEKTPGMTPYLFRRFGKELLQLIRHGLQNPPIESPPERRNHVPWDTATMQRYQALRQWRKKRAEDRGVDPVVILPTEDLRALAKIPKETDDPAAWLQGLSERKRAAYGEEILQILKTPPPAPASRRRRKR